jgi:hypothetical protein
MTRPQFYVPNITFWQWDRLTRTFLDVQRKRVMESWAETENALGYLDSEVDAIELELRSKWASGSVQVMRAFEVRLKEIRSERKRIEGVRFRLRRVLDRMNAEVAKDRISV